MRSTVLVVSQTVHNDLFVAVAAYTLTLSQSFLPARLCSVRSLHLYIGISHRRLTSMLYSREQRRTSPAYMYMYYYYLSGIMRNSCWLQPRNSPVDAH